MRSKWRLTLPLHLMILPGLALVLIFCYGPMFGLIIAFEKYIPAKGVFDSKWVGLDNFRYVFGLPDTRQVFLNTIYIAFMKMVAGLVFPIVCALLLNEVRINWFKRSVQTMIYLPYFLSWVILGGIFIELLSPSTGLVNQFLRLLGLHEIYFLGDNRWFPYTLVATNTWKEFGFSTIVYLAALTSINPTLYEAAIVDGAGRMKQTWHVTLPGMRPIIVLMATISLGSVLNAGFEQVFNLYSTQVYPSGDIIDTFVYRLGLVSAQFGPATAIGMLQSVVSTLFISVSYYLAYRLANYRIF